MKVKTVKVSVVVDPKTTMTVTVPEYELEILRNIHGEESTQELEAGNPIEVDDYEEPTRLQMKYGREAINKVYGATYQSRIREAMRKSVSKSKE